MKKLLPLWTCRGREKLKADADNEEAAYMQRTQELLAKIFPPGLQATKHPFVYTVTVGVANRFDRDVFHARHYVLHARAVLLFHIIQGGIKESAEMQ